VVAAGIAAKAAVLGRPIRLAETSPAAAAVEERRLAFVSPGVRIGKPLPRRIPFDGEWRSPSVTGTTDISSIYELGAGRHVSYGPDLIDELNAEYASKPIVPVPPDYGAGTLDAAARRRLEWVHNMVDLRDKRVLEIGCGNGFEVWSAAHNFGADAAGVGVGVTRYPHWDELRGPSVDLRLVDISAENPFEPRSFDRIMSFTVWEHVAHPYALLEQAYKLLKPGGLMFLRVNLFFGPQASHRYRDIFFPWPHLLFSDEAVRAWDERHGRPPIGQYWINRLSWHHYQTYFAHLGFVLRHVKCDRVAIDEPFYTRFEHVLGQYPRWDLETDYFTAVIQQPRRPKNRRSAASR
jgi:SAM-dependent methyltransferase